jgi:hypothetical protein
MVAARQLSRVVAAAIIIIAFVSTVTGGSLEDRLSAYTGRNAEGYLDPMVDALGANLNSGLFRGAHIPDTGPYFSIEFLGMANLFGDKHKTFRGVSEEGFSPETTLTVPTIVGPGEAVTVEGDSGTSFSFPGGFNLNSFGTSIAQLRVGSFRGTEVMIRYLAVELGDVDLGSIDLFGFGLRHSVSQYFDEDFPVDLAAGFFWQRLKMGSNNAGGDLMSSNSLTVAGQVGKRFPVAFLTLEPYGGVSVDWFSMEVEYQSTASGEPEIIKLDFGARTTARLTFGLNAELSFLKAYAEYSVAQMNALAVGIGLGN